MSIFISYRDSISVVTRDVEEVREISFPDKILGHIANVRDWLDRAEQDYQSQKNWQGELNLNLAQAELKKAWEESQRLHSLEKVVYMSPRPAELKAKVRYSKAKNAKWTSYRRFSKNQTSIAIAILLLILVSITSIFGLGGLNSTDPNIAAIEAREESGLNHQFEPVVSGVPDSYSGVGAPGANSRQAVQMNRLAYNQVSLTRTNSSKEVFGEVFREVFREGPGVATGIQMPQIEANYQPAQLQSGKLTSANSERRNFAEQTIYSDQLSTEQNGLNEPRSLIYDLESLIQLAEDELYVKK